MFLVTMDSRIYYMQPLVATVAWRDFHERPRHEHFTCNHFSRHMYFVVKRIKYLKQQSAPILGSIILFILQSSTSRL